MDTPTSRSIRRRSGWAHSKSNNNTKCIESYCVPPRCNIWLKCVAHDMKYPKADEQMLHTMQKK